VAADTGNIGGKASHEFQVIADTGEDAIAYCPTSDYAANIEMAEALPLLPERGAPAEALVKAPTPGKEKCEDVAALLGLPLARTVKSIVLAVDRLDEAGNPGPAEIWLVLVRGDHELNEVKSASRRAEGRLPVRFGSRDPRHLRVQARLPRADRHAQAGKARGRPHRREHERLRDRRQRTGLPLHRRQLGRDLAEPLVADVRSVVAGDPSPDGKGVLAIQRGIEVGHVFAGCPIRKR